MFEARTKENIMNKHDGGFMEHLQVQANTNPKWDVFAAPQEVIDALVTLTQVGLLTWNEGAVRPTFELYEYEGKPMLNHIHDEDEDDAAGYLMHITRDQFYAINKAIEQEREGLAKAQAAAAGK
jgi:hypothetical protein